MGSISTLIYASELILCSTICVHSATQDNIYINSGTLLFRTRLIRSPRYFERRSNIQEIFSRLLSASANSDFEFPAMLTHRSFPIPVNQPRYFELVKNKVQEETPKRPTKNERSVNRESRLSHATVCLLLREPRFDGKQASCHSRSTKVLEKNKNNRTLSFHCNSIC